VYTGSQSGPRSLHLVLTNLDCVVVVAAAAAAAAQSFKTVSAAIGSHPGHMAVTLEFQRCADP
jgi:hypothetical protein